MKVYFLILLVALLGIQAIDAWPKRNGIIPDCSQYDDGETLPDCNSCSKYYLCIGGESIPRRCAPGLCYDTISGLCNTAQLVNCALNRLSHHKNHNTEPEISETEFLEHEGPEHEKHEPEKPCTTTVSTPAKKPCTPTAQPSTKKPCTPTVPPPTKKPCTPTAHPPTKKPCPTTASNTTKKPCTPTVPPPTKKPCTPTAHPPTKKPCTPTAPTPHKKPCTPTVSTPAKKPCTTTTCTTTKKPAKKPCTTTTCTTTKKPCITTTCPPTKPPCTEEPQTNDKENTLRVHINSRDCRSLPDGTILIDRSRCDRWYKCANRRTLHKYCRPGQCFDPATRACRYAA